MLYNLSVITPLRVVQVIVESFGVKEPSRPKPRLFCWTTCLVFCRFFLQNLCKASLKICILKLYMRGFTIEFARYKASTSQITTGAETHPGQNPLVEKTRQAGIQTQAMKQLQYKVFLKAVNCAPLIDAYDCLSRRVRVRSIQCVC